MSGELVLPTPFFKRDSWGRYEVRPDPRAIAFGDCVRRARRMAGCSQQRLADVSGISQSVISRLERGKAPGVSLERLIVLCDTLGRYMPLGFCPHEHECSWPRIMPVAYDHPAPRDFRGTLPIVDKPVHRAGTSFYNHVAGQRSLDRKRHAPRYRGAAQAMHLTDWPAPSTPGLPKPCT